MKKGLFILLNFIIFISLQSPAQTCSGTFLPDMDSENVVKIEKNQIVVNGEIQPNLYGAEFQYFRLRGGYEKNIPREKVLTLWNQDLSQMVKAGMNTISFYIPWDFHEYAPGKFDFSGTVDLDGDSRPDYPSRDILTFLKLVQQHGIKKILLRPGPYINAEWGFLGFGAVPEWFHDQYPKSHMLNSDGFKTKLYDYHNEDFLRHTKLWFEELHRQVLVNVIGKDKPGIFLQLDNETNFQWQSIYSHDYGPGATTRYQQMMKNHYRSLAAVNLAQNTQAKSWKEVLPPKTVGKNLQQDQDWYRFQDRSIFEYIKKVKNLWNEVGVREPNVIFTMVESFNAPKGGLLPNYKYRNNKKTGLMTINVYPKTWPAPENVLLHQPHKSDYDIISASSANQHYLGKKQEAVIGPEIDTGWFGTTVLTEAARQQTYLTLIGRGLKAMYFYYFNEGDNWQVEWGQNQILPYFKSLRSEARYSQITTAELPDVFWGELQAIVDHEFMVGWNVKGVILEDVTASQKLHFGAPLDAQGKPTEHFALIEEIGQKIMIPYGEFLSQTVSLTDKVALIADSGSVVPSSIPGVDSRELNSDFAGGLIGLIQQSGINPSIHHWGINSTRELARNKVIIVQDSGNLNPRLVQWLAEYIANGGSVVSFIGDSVARVIGAPTTATVSSQVGAVPVTYKAGGFDALAASVSEYSIMTTDKAKPILTSGEKVIGYQYQYQKGSLIQIGAVIHDAFNSDAYAFLKDVPQRRALLDDILKDKQVESQVSIAEGADRLDVFGRKAPNDERLWITTKSGQLEKTHFHIRVSASLIRDRKAVYSIKNVLTGEEQILSGENLVAAGYVVNLPPNGSAAFLVTPQNAKL